MLDAIWEESPDAVLHLGDHASDCEQIIQTFPRIYLRAVRGNCDFGEAELDRDEFVLGGKRFFMTHGNLYGVKMGLDSLVNTAMCAEADVVLFGHTHIPFYDEYGELHIINPGSVGYDGDYGVIEINNDKIEYTQKNI